MIKYLLEKEFKQLLRNPMLPRILLVFPCIILLVLPWAANFEIKNMNLSVVDNDRSPYSTRLVQKVGASEYFHLVDVSNSYQEAMQCIEKGDADLILEIPPHFERDLLKTGVAKVLVSANTVNGTKRLCQNADTAFFYAQSPDFLKPGLCYYPKFSYL